MSSTAQLIDLLGAGALLLWGLRLIKTGILRGFGPSLRQAIARGTGNRLKAALSGLLATLALQSSTATAVITASFAERRLIASTAHCIPDISGKRRIQRDRGQLPAEQGRMAMFGQALGVRCGATDAAQEGQFRQPHQ